MKRVKRRAWSALILAAALILGLGVYTYRFAVYGRDWANFRANQSVWETGTLAMGTVTDRNGAVLADIADGKRVYSDDAETRIATLHAVGDAGGNIGTGALRVFADRLSGYNPVTGVSGGSGTVTLSIDAELCKIAYAALAGRKGAVMVSDYTTGEILCMVSAPSYDPTVGFDESDSAYDGAYLNRCLSAAYTPGSVFKLVTLAAAIEKLPDLGDRTFTCGGSVNVDGNTVVCTAAHGEQTIEEALAHSCNVAFAQLSLELGGETLAQYAEALGLTSAPSLDGIATAAGNFDAAAAGSADLAWSGIGQSTDLVCPYALLRCVSAIANGGAVREPTLLCGERTKTTRVLSADTAEAIRSMMNYNVVSAYGEESFPGLTLCAKSGTAEVGDGTSHAWFTGFLADDPEHPYAFVVVIEHGGGGLRSAGPVANAVLQAAVNQN